VGRCRARHHQLPCIRRSTCKLVTRDGQPLPDPNCTPGAVNPTVRQDTIKDTICQAGWTKTVRPPTSKTNKKKTASARSYNLTPGDKGEYDHWSASNSAAPQTIPLRSSSSPHSAPTDRLPHSPKSGPAGWPRGACIRVKPVGRRQPSLLCGRGVLRASNAGGSGYPAVHDGRVAEEFCERGRR